LNNKSFQLACSPDSENQLRGLAEEIDRQLSKMKASNPSASFELLLVMTALSQQDRISTLESKLGATPDEIEVTNNSEFADTLSTIAGYLENLAQKIGR
jgi:cell division protein ZapA